MTEINLHIVNSEWLKAELNAPDLVVLDASSAPPGEKRDADAEFMTSHIPGAQRFDFNRDIVDSSSLLPSMLPTPTVFQEKVRALGVCKHSRIVIYEGASIFAAPRAWWMFKAMGHGAVVVLDGGLVGWHQANGEVASGPSPSPASGDFESHLDRSRVAGMTAVREGLRSGVIDVVDARSPTRFEGRQPEPRPGLRSGHMPGARNLPFERLLIDGHYCGAAEMLATFESIGVSGKKPIITTCGSGVTASILALGAEIIGLGPAAVYDGSWSEWGLESHSELPVATGPTSTP